MVQNKYKIIQYHTSWSNYGRNFQVADLPIDYMHEVSYAFFDLRQNPQGFYVPTSGDTWADFDKRYTQGRVIPPPDTWNDASGVFGNFGQFRKLKANGKQFHLTLSIGGWTWSKYFSLAVRTPEARRVFVEECVKFMKTYTFFDGVSMDWEYPSNDGKNYGNDGNITDPNDDVNFLQFLKDLRVAFNSNGLQRHTISICCVAAPEKIKFSAGKYAEVVDEFHVMTYDFAGGWDLSNATHQTNVYKTNYSPYSVDTAVKSYLSMGVPSRKIYIGAAFYSRGFGGTDGLGKPARTNSPDKSWEDGVVDYKALPVSGSQEFYDMDAHGAYSYDSVRKVLNTYDNVQSITEKCNYIKRNNLGGIIVWESSGDTDISNPRSLTACLYNNLVVNQDKIMDIPNNGNSQQPVQPVVTQPPVSQPQQPVQPVVPSQPQQPAQPGQVNAWVPNTAYLLGQTVSHSGNFYSVIQSHQSLPGWEPNVTENILWRKISPPVAQPPVSQPPVTQPPVSQPPVSQPPVAQPPVSQPPVAQPPVSQPPVAQPPVSHPPETQPPVAQPPVSQPVFAFDVESLTDSQLDRLFERLFERHCRKR